MAVIFRLPTRKDRGHRTCCFCDRRVEGDPVELFVFWPGDEDPTPWFAHPACVSRHSAIAKAAAGGESDTETGS